MRKTNDETIAMDQNPYNAPSAISSPDIKSSTMSLRNAALRGAKLGALIGTSFVAVGGIIAGGVVLFFAVRLEMRAEGGFMYAVERLTEKKPVFEIIGGFAAALAVFAGWGAVIGAIALTLSAWSRRNRHHYRS